MKTSMASGFLSTELIVGIGVADAVAGDESAVNFVPAEARFHDNRIAQFVSGCDRHSSCFKLWWPGPESKRGCGLNRAAFIQGGLERAKRQRCRPDSICV